MLLWILFIAVVLLFLALDLGIFHKNAEIISNKGKLQFFLNGEKVLETTMWDDHWKEMIAKSKFHEFPGFGTYNKGKLCLQDHGDKVWFKNIKIKSL